MSAKWRARIGSATASGFTGSAMTINDGTRNGASGSRKLRISPSSTGSSTVASTVSSEPAIEAMPSGCSSAPNVPPDAVGAALRMPTRTSAVTPAACSCGTDARDQPEGVEQRVALQHTLGRVARQAERRILHHGGDHEVRVTLRERRRGRAAERVAHHDARRSGRLLDRGDSVAHVAVGGVLPRRAVRRAVPAEVEAQHTEALGEGRDDPVPRAAERGDPVQQQDRWRRRVTVLGDVEFEGAIADLHVRDRSASSVIVGLPSRTHRSRRVDAR